jgi:hypothetical protein
MSSRGYRNFFKWGVGGQGSHINTQTLYILVMRLLKKPCPFYTPLCYFLYDIYMILLYKQRFSYWDKDRGQRGQRYWYLFDIVEKSLCPF